MEIEDEIIGKSRVINVDVESEMQKSFMSYAMAVNVSRAIPDVRDGLKPVHRRILYAMGDANLFNSAPYKKCAATVGDVLGRYHPHGDTAVYDAMVRLAQDFSIRCPLIDGHGNFGSVDGDPAAAMRYTEARLSKIAGEMLRDLDKECVDFYPNFDGTLMQPQVLPSRFPNILVNGADGIAVGMATNIPPHNLGEAIDCVVAMIKNPEITVDELLEILPAPDYPTGGIIMGGSAIKHAYKTGRGGIVIRAKTEIIEENGRSSIVVTELPYQVNKAKLIISIADLVKDKKIDGIMDIKEESDRHGMRVVIDVKKDANPQVVLNLLFKHTNLQVSNGIILLALVGKEPKIMNLKEIIYYYLEHQREVIVRRTKFDLNKAEEKEHIVEGLVIAQDNIDEVIKIIKSATDKQEASVKLITRFGLSDKQTNSILEMKLQRLTGLEVGKLKTDLEELKTLIIELKSILASKEKVDGIIEKEILEIKDKNNTPRRTEICVDYGDIDIEDLIPRENVVISMTRGGYIKRMLVSEYRAQRRGGVGVLGHKTKEEDVVNNMFICNSHDELLAFTTKGRVYKLKAYTIPEALKTAKGRSAVNLLNLMPEEKLTTILIRPKNDDGFLVMVTKKGVVKRLNIQHFANIQKNGKYAIGLHDDDELIGVRSTQGDSDILIATYFGRCIRFSEKQVRPSGRMASGVKGVKLRGGDDYVVDMESIKDGEIVVTISELGIGKRLDTTEIRKTARGGFGVYAGKFNKKTGHLAGLKKVNIENDIILVTQNGQVIRTSVESISAPQRLSMGVKIMNLKEDNKVVCVSVADKEEASEAELKMLEEKELEVQPEPDYEFPIKNNDLDDDGEELKSNDDSFDDEE